MFPYLFNLKLSNLEDLKCRNITSLRTLILRIKELRPKVGGELISVWPRPLSVTWWRESGKDSSHRNRKMPGIFWIHLNPHPFTKKHMWHAASKNGNCQEGRQSSHGHFECIIVKGHIALRGKLTGVVLFVIRDNLIGVIRLRFAVII